MPSEILENISLSFYWKTEHSKAFAKNDNTSAIADHVQTTRHIYIKWDHFDILVKGKTDYHCKIKETLFKILTVIFENVSVE